MSLSFLLSLGTDRRLGETGGLTFATSRLLCAAVSFIAGIVLVFLKYPFFGVIIEMFGFLNLFGCVLSSLLSPDSVVSRALD